MKFSPVGQSVARGILVYIEKEYSFETVGCEETNGRAAMLNDVSIEFSDSGQAISIWGLCPRPSWINSYVTVPKIEKSTWLFVDETPEPGISRSIRPPSGEWNIYFDSSSGWLRFGLDPESNAKSYLFLENCIATVLDGELCAMFLKPKIV